MADLTWHPEAVRDLDEICDFIGRDAPAAAHAFADRVYSAVHRVEAVPRSGRVVPEAEDENIREVLVGAYRVIYRLTAAGIQVVMVYHGVRLLREIRQAGPDAASDELSSR